MRARQKIIVAVLSFGTFSILFLGLVLYPVFQGVVRDHKEVLAYRRELLQLRADQESSSEFGKIAGQYAGEFQRMENLFVDGDAPIALFRFLDEAAASFGLRAEKALGSLQRLRGDRWSSLEVRLAGDGSYPDIMAFLQKIENAPYLLEVKTFNMSQKRGVQQSQERIEFSLSMKVFMK